MAAQARSDEYTNAHQRAVLFDVSDRGKLEVSGPDAAKFLHNMCTNDVVNLASGAGREALLTTGQAKIVAHVFIYHAHKGDFWLDAGPGMGEAVYKHLDHFHVAEQFELADRTQEWAQFHLAGPKATEVLGRALGEEPPALLELEHVMRSVGSKISMPIRRHDALGLLGYDLLCPRDQVGVACHALVTAGAAPADMETYHVLRVEAGMPLFGVDIDASNLPQEVGRMEQTVSFTKGCYIGQETVARIRTYGHVNRTLVGLKLGSDKVVAAGAKLVRDGAEVGHVTSSVLSPQLGRAIALAYVRRGSQEPGTALAVEAEGNRWTAEVVSLPFGAGGGSGGK
jgi:tRNA-modifying protein YgfZ